jgi:glutathione peroxidase-family protein
MPAAISQATGFQPRCNISVFNANLQEFSQRLSLIANLATNGKLFSEESYTQVEALWQQLQTSKNQLGIGQSFGEQSGGAPSSCS